jgi:hypothetical protein
MKRQIPVNVNSANDVVQADTVAEPVNTFDDIRDEQ